MQVFEKRCISCLWDGEAFQNNNRSISIGHKKLAHRCDKSSISSGVDHLPTSQEGAPLTISACLHFIFWIENILSQILATIPSACTSNDLPGSLLFRNCIASPLGQTTGNSWADVLMFCPYLPPWPQLHPILLQNPLVPQSYPDYGMVAQTKYGQILALTRHFLT